ncbi:MAG: FAD binding domain-containing protein [Anaerolineae bacterium]|nr:FAD binding domain-containing protein [Anaerolineae bacterium]
MWSTYYQPSTIQQTLDLLDEFGRTAKISAGATDLILEFRNGNRKDVSVIIDVSRIPDQGNIWIDENQDIHLGMMVSHSDCVASAVIRRHAFPLAQACWSVGSPQIRNRGTVIGNLVTASPANDTISPLIALDAKVKIESHQGQRMVPLSEFYLGVRKTILAPNELVTEILIPSMDETMRGVFIKHALRNAQAISLVNCTVILQVSENLITHCVVTYGAVAPMIIHARGVEDYLKKRNLEDSVIKRAEDLAQTEVSPISDIRCSAAYRKAMSAVLLRRALLSLRDTRVSEFPEKPVLLWGHESNPLHANPLIPTIGRSEPIDTIDTLVNGKRYQVKSASKKTLLQMLRDDLHLMGTKEGCAEGECGACTVYLDGAAVLACLIPAGRAHESSINTIEGLSIDGHLSPVQQAFVDGGAVQCGFCTPGFVMSATKLLEENASPTRDEIKAAISGNLCRCTGYYQIIEAIENAAKELE